MALLICVSIILVMLLVYGLTDKKRQMKLTEKENELKFWLHLLK